MRDRQRRKAELQMNGWADRPAGYCAGDQRRVPQHQPIIAAGQVVRRIPEAGAPSFSPPPLDYEQNDDSRPP
jgi:hypothetical protein